MKSETVEDYLKAIFQLQEKEGRAKTSRLAAKLGLAAGTVTEMLQRLSRTQPRLLDYRQHQGVRLTAEGRAAALDVIRRHRLLETFLHDILGLSWDEVHPEAEALEHHLSTRVTEALEDLLRRPEYDPHGEPIPDRHGILPAVSHRKLSEVDVGQSARIVRVQPIKSDLLRYLDDIGIGIDTVVKVVAKAPLDGPISLLIGEGPSAKSFALGRNIADHLFVEAVRLR